MPLSPRIFTRSTITSSGSAALPFFISHLFFRYARIRQHISLTCWQLHQKREIASFKRLSEYCFHLSFTYSGVTNSLPGHHLKIPFCFPLSLSFAILYGFASQLTNSVYRSSTVFSSAFFTAQLAAHFAFFYSISLYFHLMDSFSFSCMHPFLVSNC